jgi:tRNA 2-thiocytidine biosynthesis protein TtcA
VVGVSGGKDSLGLLYSLWWLRQLYHLPHELYPVHVTDNQGADEVSGPLGRWAAELALTLTTVRTNLRPSPGSTVSPCFACSWNRKKALFQTAERLGCSVIALGHHSDDVAVTGLMNLFLQGRFGSILPSQTYFRGRFKLVRPLYFASEHSLVRLARVEALPVHSVPCAFAHGSKRMLARSWLDAIVRDQPSAKRSLLGALHREAMARAGSDLGAGGRPGFATAPTEEGGPESS